jgi:predicted RND superfamily exporter protein
MEPMLRRSALSLCLLPFVGLAQRHPARLNPRSGESADIQSPNGKSQTDEILKEEREENLKDAAKLVDLADELKEALEKEDRFVFSLNTVKKTEEIEKLARKIRARMRHE